MKLINFITAITGTENSFKYIIIFIWCYELIAKTNKFPPDCFYNSSEFEGDDSDEKLNYILHVHWKKILELRY